MPSYQIYLPGGHGADPTQLAKVGLEIPDMYVGASAIDIAQGPDGNRGVVFHWHDADPDHAQYNPLPGYHPEMQEWTPAKARAVSGHGLGVSGPENATHHSPLATTLPAARFWLGRESGRPVEPESIQRRTWLDGTLLPLGDGQEWIIPAAPMLPQKIGLDEFGNPARQVDPKYQRYWDQVVAYYEIHLRVREDFEAVSRENLTLEKVWPFAIQTLQFNYRVDANIIDWLGLLDEETIVRLVLRTFLGDQIRLADALKKKRAAQATAATSSANASPSPSATATTSTPPGAAA